jgi:tRNA(fMet)-specific endonuclease VapC
VYCFDTDVLSSVLKREPSLEVIRRMAVVPSDAQFTTSITLAELLYGAARLGSATLAMRIRNLIVGAITVLPFDVDAAEAYGTLRAGLGSEGRRLDEPDLRIAAIAVARNLTLVSGNVRHFARVPNLTIENWLRP